MTDPLDCPTHPKEDVRPISRRFALSPQLPFKKSFERFGVGSLMLCRSRILEHRDNRAQLPAKGLGGIHFVACRHFFQITIRRAIARKQETSTQTCRPHQRQSAIAAGVPFGRKSGIPSKVGGQPRLTLSGPKGVRRERADAHLIRRKKLPWNHSERYKGVAIRKDRNSLSKSAALQGAA